MSKKPSLNLRKIWNRDGGFSLTELVVALAIALILAGIGLPSFLRAYHSYQLTAAATQVADVVRLTRYEAIRLNKPVNCRIESTGTVTNIWSDSNGNNTVDVGEKTFVLQTWGNLVDAGTVPGIGALATAANLGVTPVNPSPTNGTVQFDARGAVIPTGTVTALYLANTTTQDPGYRVVILMPAGSVQIWTADATGYWQQLR